MRALITNDDGVTSTGIRVLASGALEVGLEVVVAAPSWDSSGASASLTAVIEDGRFTFRPVRVEGLDQDCLAVDAAPAFITRAAVGGAFGEPPDIVLSGINRGLNGGQSIVHSGTVGAVTTGAIYDRPGVAFSIDGGESAAWDTAHEIVVEVLGWWIAQEPPAVVLNVNIPDVEPAELRGLTRAPLADFGAVTVTLTSREAGSVLMQYEAPVGEPEPGSDVALVRDGWATFTALQPLCEATGASVGGLARSGPAHGSPS